MNSQKELIDFFNTNKKAWNNKTLFHLKSEFYDLEDFKQVKSSLKFIELEELGDVKFICSNIYDIENHLNKKFDIVFTSYGTIGWLPDLKEWGRLISHYLKPGGIFYIVEFHTVLWMFDDEFKNFKYSYFNHGEIEEEVEGTYADMNAPLKQT